MMTPKEQHFCLRWNEFQSNFSSEFENLREEENFIDVTLACAGKFIKAHRLVLSACSQYFKCILKEIPCKHPVIIMQEISYNHMKLLLDFMYLGEVNVTEEELPFFLQTADNLQIRGLMDASHQYKGTCENMNKHTGLLNIKTESENENISNKRTIFTKDMHYEGNVNLNGTYQHNSVSNRNTDITRNNVQMEYSSDEDIKPDISAVSLLEIDTSNSRMSYTPLRDKTENKMANVESSGSGVEIQPFHSQGTNEVVKYHSLDPRPCPACGRLYSNMSNLRQHIRLIHRPESISCPLCSKLFKNKLYLKRHLISFHELPPPSASSSEHDKIKNCQKPTSVNSPHDYGNQEGASNIFSYSNLFMSSSVVRSVSEFKSYENANSISHNDFLPVTPSTGLEMQKFSDHSRQGISSNKQDNFQIAPLDKHPYESNYYKPPSLSYSHVSEVHNTSPAMSTISTSCSESSQMTDKLSTIL